MKCVHCQGTISPQMQTKLLGENGRGLKVHLYHQICPYCKEVILGIRETDSFDEQPTALGGLKFLIVSPPLE